MSLARWKKEEMSRDGLHGGRPSRSTLAAVESLAMPLMQEVVFLADLRCPRCQQRVAEIMTKMNGEMVISVVEKKVTLTCSYPIGRQLARRTSIFLRLFRH